MNFLKIEQRLQVLDLRDSLSNHRFNPTTPKIPGLSKHIHTKELGLLKKEDSAILGHNIYTSDSHIPILDPQPKFSKRDGARTDPSVQSVRQQSLRRTQTSHRSRNQTTDAKF
jgi:hypothetical protein